MKSIPPQHPLSMLATELLLTQLRLFHPTIICLCLHHYTSRIFRCKRPPLAPQAAWPMLEGTSSSRDHIQASSQQTTYSVRGLPLTNAEGHCSEIMLPEAVKAEQCSSMAYPFNSSSKTRLRTRRISMLTACPGGTGARHTEQTFLQKLTVAK